MKQPKEHNISQIPVSKLTESPPSSLSNGSPAHHPHFTPYTHKKMIKVLIYLQPNSNLHKSTNHYRNLTIKVEGSKTMPGMYLSKIHVPFISKHGEPKK